MGSRAVTDDIVEAEIVAEEPTQLAVYQPTHPAEILSDPEIDRIYRISKALALSNYFGSVKSAEQAFAKILLGRELGLSATQALQGLHIVKGNLMVAYPMLGQFIRARPGYDYDVVEHDAEHCVIEFVANGKVRGRSAFSIDDARRAGLVRGDSAWTSHPSNMVFARALSNGVKWFMPEVLNGMPVYVDDEIPGREPDPQVAVADPELPPPLTDEIAIGLQAQARGLYAQIRERDGAMAMPPAQFDVYLRQAWHSHEALNALIATLTAKLPEEDPPQA